MKDVSDKHFHISGWMIFLIVLLFIVLATAISTAVDYYIDYEGWKIERADTQDLINDLTLPPSSAKTKVVAELEKRCLEGSVPMDVWIKAAQNPNPKIRDNLAQVIGNICLQLPGPEEGKYMPVLMSLLRAEGAKDSTYLQEAFRKVEFANGFDLLVAETSNPNLVISDTAEDMLSNLSILSDPKQGVQKVDQRIVEFLASRIADKTEAEAWLNSLNCPGKGSAARTWASNNGYTEWPVLTAPAS